MKKSLFLVIALCLSFLSYGQEFIAGSYNIRQRNTVDVDNMWNDRKVPLTNLIKYHGFDIFGIQEGFFDQVQDLKKLLPGFDYVGVGRDDGAQEGEHSAIYYNTNRFKAIKSGTFWLSASDTEHPNKGWDAALPRICTWGIFEDKANKKRFIFMNTHFDHIGRTARTESAKLILTKAKEFAKDLPLILTGDFNVDEQDEAYFTLANSKVVTDVHELATFKYEPNSSFNGWGKSIRPTGRIDHIFITKPFQVKKYGILTDTYMNKFPSDHFPVATTLSWK
ncbi:endonuclease/exonuclease/phosphatase family protein [Sphingobacterium siyangense]|uniref:Endonuclease/exonuclease/phosphatase family metal-dependent hydrolase n=1 Tax=Sphingobacterium siyangense TaxID=459529 RepID=A0A562MRZ3_9SPHI|nr:MULTISPECIES: endonuclease/exonuclease/phosphatase family protein [Sphingobacterium]TWI22639.1 endonuclease/exonuclease/phosphatase family metal-dependent hydrolase [Sphingobacterium siyangense]HAL53268.1 endonuclease [Sphingobacterium sp.]